MDAFFMENKQWRPVQCPVSRLKSAPANPPPPQWDKHYSWWMDRKRRWITIIHSNTIILFFFFCCGSRRRWTFFAHNNDICMSCIQLDWCKFRGQGMTFRNQESSMSEIYLQCDGGSLWRLFKGRDHWRNQNIRLSCSYENNPGEKKKQWHLVT